MVKKVVPTVTEEDADFADAAVDEMEKLGHTDKSCPRCGSELVIDMRGNSYKVACSKCDFKITSRGI